MTQSFTEYIVLDVETTGVNAAVDDIIEFAAVRLNDRGEVVGELDILISTPQTLSPTVIAITNIQPEDLVGQPSIEQVADQIRDFIGTAPIVGHNIGFDIEFLNSKGLGLTNPALDTLELAYAVLPAQTYYSLEYLSYRFGFGHQPSHRAMADVLATVDLFKFLVFQISELSEATRQKANQLVPAMAWTWGWLIHQPLNWQPPEFTPAVAEDESEQLATVAQSAKEQVDAVVAAKAGRMNFVETHFDGDPDALALATAIRLKPAVLVVPDRLFFRANWTKVGQGLGVELTPRYPIGLWYRPDAEVELATAKEPLGALEAKLITKVVIWREEWKMDYSQLYLTRDEQYQWEQKLSPLVPGDEPVGEVLITPPAGLLEMANRIEGRAVISAHPMLIEDAMFNVQSRTLSVNYFAAVINSRRDFVHQYIREVDVKLADRLFKIINHLGGALQHITEQLTRLYAGHPPVSVYERSVELTPTIWPESLGQLLSDASTKLTEYAEGIGSMADIPADRQIERTHKLIKDLQALSELSDDRRYFLFADEHRFFLDIVPAVSDSAQLKQLSGSARELVLLGPGLAVGGYFDYWQQLFGEGAGAIIGHTPKTDLLVAQDMPEGNDYSLSLTKLAGGMLERGGKTLFLLNSAYEARQLFQELYPRTKSGNVTLESYDTVGNPELVPWLLAKNPNFVLVGHYYWFDRLRSYADGFDRLILGRLPFEAVSRPQSKVLSDREDGFNRYTLARGIMRLKEILHAAKATKKPLILLDSRLVTRDYGRQVMASLPAFTVILEDSETAIGG